MLLDGFGCQIVEFRWIFGIFVLILRGLLRLGVVLLEAAAMELPTIATRVTGCLDAVADGRTGTLVPLGSIAQLVNAVRRYVNEPALRRQHGEAGRQRVIQDFRSTAIWSSLADYYAQSLQQYESSSSQLKAA